MADTLYKSLSDKKEYKLIILSSGLEVLLISSTNRHRDVSAEKQKAAAALCVQAGSFGDDPECEGLAHFLEHMVFMGRLSKVVGSCVSSFSRFVFQFLPA